MTKLASAVNPNWLVVNRLRVVISPNQAGTLPGNCQGDSGALLVYRRDQKLALVSPLIIGEAFQAEALQEIGYEVQ